MYIFTRNSFPIDESYSLAFLLGEYKKKGTAPLHRYLHKFDTYTKGNQNLLFLLPKRISSPARICTYEYIICLLIPYAKEYRNTYTILFCFQYLSWYANLPPNAWTHSRHRFQSSKQVYSVHICALRELAVLCFQHPIRIGKRSNQITWLNAVGIHCMQ